MSYEETLKLTQAAAERLGYPGEALAPDSFRVSYDWTGRGKGRPIASPERADEILREVANDPRFKPSVRAKAAQLLKGAIKSALSAKNLLTDATIGAAAGAASAVGGYASAAPRSAGLFTAPGEGYEGVASPELIERIAAEKEAENAAERLRLLDQYRASGYDIDPNTRLRDLR
jgi:hypothetical protein